jgi:hypothetical protein
MIRAKSGQYPGTDATKYIGTLTRYCCMERSGESDRRLVLASVAMAVAGGAMFVSLL